MGGSHTLVSSGCSLHVMVPVMTELPAALRNYLCLGLETVGIQQADRMVHEASCQW